MSPFLAKVLKGISYLVMVSLAVGLVHSLFPTTQKSFTTDIVMSVLGLIANFFFVRWVQDQYHEWLNS